MIPLSYEKRKWAAGLSWVLGTDEVGRGSLAGPVVAATVAFDSRIIGSTNLGALKGVRDSKLLSPSQREVLATIIKREASSWSVGVVSPLMIDRINIHHASLRAMSLSVEKVVSQVVSNFGNMSPIYVDTERFFLFVDGKFAVPKIHIKQQAVIDGDAKVFSVAAASIIAKVYRDRLMQKLHVKLPQYNFAKHKGYGTMEHQRQILLHGLSEYHRKSFCGKFLLQNR